MNKARARDSRRNKLYTAERVLEKYSTRLFSIEEAQDFLKKNMSRKYITERYPEATDPVIVERTWGRSSWAYGTRRIRLNEWGFTQWILLHEMSHIVSKRHFGLDIAGHGWEFARTYLDIIRAVFGIDAYHELKTSFREHKVKFNPPRAKRVLTEEQKQVMIARMEKARAARKVRGV